MKFYIVIRTGNRDVVPPVERDITIHSWSTFDDVEDLVRVECKRFVESVIDVFGAIPTDWRGAGAHPPTITATARSRSNVSYKVNFSVKKLLEGDTNATD